MDAKTILAFVLSFVVLLLWSFFFSQNEEQATRKEGEPAEIGQERRVVEVPKAPAVSPPPQTPTQEGRKPEAGLAVSEREVKVETPLYRAVFGNVGPTIKSFKLKKYRQSTDPDSPPIEMVGLEQGMGDFLSVGFQSPKGLGGNPKAVYEVDEKAIRLGPESSPRELVFRQRTEDGLSVQKVFRFYPDRYRIDLEVGVANGSEQTAQGAFEATLRAVPPEEKSSYYSYVGLVLLMNDELEEVKLKKASEEKTFTGDIDWVAYEDDYFISAVVPEGHSKGTFKGERLASGLLEGSYSAPSLSIGPSEQTSSAYTLYFGPRDLDILKDFGKKLDKAVDFGWTDIIAKPLLYVLHFFNQYIHNFGVSIILLTILVKILFWPLTHKSYKSMKEMQKLQPRLAKIREKYKNNKEQMNKEMMALYKTYKVNPMGGCLPMIIQIPVFFALFRILGNAIELRHAPFMLWINDLSAPDRLFHFPFKIPFMAPPSGIPVLTLLMGASMFIQQKMTPTPGDPTQAKIMMFLPIIFTFLFINFPSGLVLYWLVNNILSIGQQYRIHKSPA